MRVSVTVSACDLDAEDGTVTEIRMVCDVPGEKTAVEPPFSVISAQPIALEIPIWNASA